MQPQVSLLTKQEVADRLRVSVRTVERLTSSGELLATRVRGAVRYSSSEIDRYLGCPE